MVGGLVALAVVSWQRRRVAPAVLGLVGFVLLFVLIMTLGAKKLDRYMLPAILALQVLAGVGLWRLGRRLWQRSWRSIVLLVALGTQVALFAQASPYLLTAYNPLLGGVHGASRLVLVGWGEGLDQAADYLNARPDAEQLVATTQYHDVLRPLFRGTTVRMGDRKPLDYCVVYLNMRQRDMIPRAVRATMAAELPEFTVYLQGEPYAAIYRMRADLQQQYRDGASEAEDFEDEQD